MPPTLTRKMSSIEQWLELLEEGALASKTLVRSSSSSSLASSTESCSRNSVESGISSLSSDASLFNGHTNAGIEAYVEILNKLEQLEHLDLGVHFKAKRLTSLDSKLLSYYRKIEEGKAKATKAEDNPLKLKYKGDVVCVKNGKRNILDLGGNISESWRFQPAGLPTGVQNYFQNRSLYSRLADIHPPLHVINSCDDCGFQEIIYT